MITTLPNLWDVIGPEDVSQKGNGGYKADYVNWCLTVHYMHVHAPDWQFRLIDWHNDSGQPQSIYRAPDGSGYVMGQWRLLESTAHNEGLGESPVLTEPFPQACMDHRNKPIPYEACDARVLTDTHRRCLCTSAAAAFGLAGKLWARVAVENPHEADEISSRGDDSIVKMLAVFSKYGVTSSHLCAYLGRETIAKVTQDDMGKLRQVYSTIAQGMDAFVALGISEAGEVDESGDLGSGEGEPAFDFGET